MLHLLLHSYLTRPGRGWDGQEAQFPGYVDLPEDRGAARRARGRRRKLAETLTTTERWGPFGAPIASQSEDQDATPNIADAATFLGLRTEVPQPIGARREPSDIPMLAPASRSML